MSQYADIEAAFRTHGLALRGGLLASDGHALPDLDGCEARSLILVGNLGNAMWPNFSAARDAHPGLSLDAWTRDVTEPLAEKFGAKALYVFDGPPFHPFQQWAMTAERLRPAPNNMLIHPVYGIWQAYRAALLLADDIDIPHANAGPHPCNDCDDKPCIPACPAEALAVNGFSFESCIDHFANEPATRCNDGCLARLACPVGSEHAYPLEQRRFHMQHFVARHVKVSST